MKKKPPHSLLAICLLPLFLIPTALRSDDTDSKSTSTIAATPPMGWNSWDSFGTAVREQNVKANADYMAAHLAKYGWQYIVVDIQWYQPTAQGHDYIPGAKVALDSYGRLLPAVNRFPSSANGAGFKPLADYVHSKGLKFGIHIMRGIPRQAVDENLPIKGTSLHAPDVADKDNPCIWNPDMWGVDTTKPGSQAYYDSIVELYASWGVDFIKADDMASHLYQPAEIKALSQAIKKSGRPIVLSLSPGPAPISEVAFFRKYAQMWRISDDFWDSWPSLKEQFIRTKDWAPLVKPGAWPDADMLPLGRIGSPQGPDGRRPTNFTHDEQISLMNLWCMFRSPLIFGGDMPANDEFTLFLITNPEVLDVDQQSKSGHQSYAQGNIVAWIADAPQNGEKYLAIFNIGESPETVNQKWSALGFASQTAQARDLWTHKDLGVSESIHVTLQPHASVLYRISGT